MQSGAPLFRRSSYKVLFVQGASTCTRPISRYMASAKQRASSVYRDLLSFFLCRGRLSLQWPSCAEGPPVCSICMYGGRLSRGLLCLRRGVSIALFVRWAPTCAAAHMKRRTASTERRSSPDGPHACSVSAGLLIFPSEQIGMAPSQQGSLLCHLVQRSYLNRGPLPCGGTVFLFCL